ncbi:hypothetical protein [Thiohalorhabdus methylotrophus]|uniref:Uncharacterized protein n=1 Tax=Thiohalorhabdus methylotrophus TaxID=3242694 RepID=A0ABV4TYR2_9GAMM
MTGSKPTPLPASEAADPWGGWADADRLRREAFLLRTPAQRLKWLQDALELAYHAGALDPPAPTGQSPQSLLPE